MTDPRNFLINSDYPMDKIVQFGTGNFTLAASTSGSGSVEHELPYAPLYIIRWSTSSTFETSYDETGVTIEEIQLSAQTDSTYLYLFANNATASSVTFYYRVMYIMPTNEDLDALPTQSEDPFNLNTDYNYTKIFMEGLTETGTETITHDLGFIPQVEAWYVRDVDGRVVHLLQNDVTDTGSDFPRAIVSTTQLGLTPGVTVEAGAWHYKIYGDSL